MDFGSALEALKRGDKVARAGWNGRGMWVTMATTSGDYCFDTNECFQLEPFFIIQNVKGTHNTWVPSVSDLLAEDWEVVV